jgi:HlyD family secretion protein
VKSRSVSNAATIQLAEEKRNKAKLAMDQAQDAIGKMKVMAPMDGLVALEKNEGAAGGFFFSGMQLPEFREGDQVEAGQTVGQVIDPQGLELVAKVDEMQRNGIKEGQGVDFRLDALPAHVYHGTVKTVAGSNSKRFWENDNGATFEVSIALASTDPEMRPGLTGHVFIQSDAKKNVLYVPRNALFLKDNKRIVYVRKGASFEAREVKIDAENESRAAIDGVDAGTEIALVDPTETRKATGSTAASPGAGGTL